MPDASPSLLEVCTVSKSFPGVRALRDVSLSLKRGEVLAVIGENGAGKSTLMKILAGVHAPDSGEIRIDGKSVQFKSTLDASRAGVVLIHQELNLADNLQVGANIFLGREPHWLGWIDEKNVRSESCRLLEKVGLNVSPETPLKRLPIGKQQMVEIAKALSFEAKVLIMDEPTSSLSSSESLQLFKLIRELRSRGISIIYISHRLGEVRELADRVVVLRDGQNAGNLDRDAISHDRMVRLMVGREVSQFYGRQTHPLGDEVLNVDGLVTEAWPKESVSFQLRAGEIVGMAGLVGAGRTEILRAIFGADRRVAGRVRISGKPATIQNPSHAMQLGMALVPEDRKAQGLIVDSPVRENLSLCSLRSLSRWGCFIRSSKEKSQSISMIDKLRIKTPHDRQISRYLSGGNQQKIVLGKWLARQPKILLLDEPTRGIDIGAKQEIYQLMESLAAQGMAILFVSSELEEIIGMSDRAMVVHEGKLTGVLQRDAITEQSIMQLATGLAA